jgi:cytoskeletal protein RodZ
MALQADSPRHAVGETLNLAVLRQNCGISLQSIADSTKISKRFLAAIEAEAFEELPGGIFTVSYLKQYAAAIGMPAGELLDYYRRKTGTASAQVAGDLREPRTLPGRTLRALANLQLF